MIVEGVLDLGDGLLLGVQDSLLETFLAPDLLRKNASDGVEIFRRNFKAQRSRCTVQNYFLFACGRVGKDWKRESRLGRLLSFPLAPDCRRNRKHKVSQVRSLAVELGVIGRQP